MEMLNQKQKILVIAGIAIVSIIIIFYYVSSMQNVYNYDELAIENEVSKEEVEETKKEEKIVVHITGAVASQGIVQAYEDARINDIIELAGGLTENADISKVNLAYVVEDGQKIYIPTKGEEEAQDDGEIITQDAGENVLQEGEEKGTGIININTANQEELQNLPGIR